jgi:iron complex outermembrane receptor protein
MPPKKHLPEAPVIFSLKLPAEQELPIPAETSTNYSLGAVFRHEGFELTVDTYRIDVADRIIYSETLGVSRPSQTAQSTAAIQALLAPFGVTGARFFLNGVDTSTSGVDVVARYRTQQDFGRFDFTLAGNFNSTEVTKTPAVPSNLAIAPSDAFLFDRSSKLSFEQGTPEQKIVASVDWSLGDFGANQCRPDFGGQTQAGQTGGPTSPSCGGSYRSRYDSARA